MGLQDDCQIYFGTKDLYQVLSCSKDATHPEIKKFYRKMSLKHHPDRHEEGSFRSKEEMTKAFQVLSRVHYILSDTELRKVYDETGVTDTDDSTADWNAYFRNMFPKVTKKDIDSFYEKYIGSDEEREDVKRYYLQFSGDMDKIFEYLIGYDEERTRNLIDDLIEAGEVEPLDAYTKEPTKKRKKREGRIAKEAKESKKMKRIIDDQEQDLVQAIQSRSQANFDSLINNLEAKYGKPKKMVAAKKK